MMTKENILLQHIYYIRVLAYPGNLVHKQKPLLHPQKNKLEYSLICLNEVEEEKKQFKLILLFIAFDLEKKSNIRHKNFCLSFSIMHRVPALD